jgi:acetylornithine deacetylase/succinyl-diaminopimelate desuccinylase-like protein
MRLPGLLLSFSMALAAVLPAAQSGSEVDWTAFETETLEHFQALLRLDTSNPPGNERLATTYLQQVLEREGIPVQIFALDPNRPNLVARLRSSGARRPILLMGHTDVVTVDPKKWTFPPFSATRDGGYVYGRGALDDKPHVVAGLMAMLTIKRMNVPLDRDIIFLAEAGEEGTTRVGIDFVVKEHFPAIDAEYCLAEGGGAARIGGQVRFASIETLEKIPRSITLTAHGTSGHGSVPLKTNAIARLAAAVAAISSWQAPVRLNDTTREFFKRLAEVSSRADAERYRSVLQPGSPRAAAAADYLFEREPRYAAMLRTSISPTIVSGGYRVNVIPSEATATLDVRMLPDEDSGAFLDTLRRIINDPSIDVAYNMQRDGQPRPAAPSARVDSEAFRIIEAAVARHYQAPALPSMTTGATDMAQVRATGVQCYGTGPATDAEDAVKGFGAHSDQERILETELHRFVRFTWDIVIGLARAK